MSIEAPQQAGPEVPQQTGQEVPANDAAPQLEASQTTMSVDPWQRGTLSPKFNDPAGNKAGTGGGKGGGGGKKTGGTETQTQVLEPPEPGSSPPKKDQPAPP